MKLSKEARAAVEGERLDVAHAAADRLLITLRNNHDLRRSLRRMKLIETAVQCFEAARVLS